MTDINNSSLLKTDAKKESISIFGVAVHDAQRMIRIFGILKNFGFGNIVSAIRGGVAGDFAASNEILESFKSQSDDFAPKLREMIEALGTTYIKFGQMLSTRYDLLPPNIIAELAKLQDGSPKLSFETIESILNDAYGDYHQHFASIEHEPIGAASIAQAHRAELIDGTHVVIKVQRPNLLPLIRSDIDILQLFAKVLDSHIEEIAYFNLPALIDEFERSIVSELNFNHERENIEYFIETYGANKMFVFPEPNRKLSRQNILVMKEIIGKKITLAEQNSPEASKMADAILDIAFDMVMRHGIFHADPHPGNVFATPDNRIGLIDFGLVGTFTPRQRQEFMRMILAIQSGDCAIIARSLIALGHPIKRVVLKDLEAEISNIIQKYYKNSLDKIDLAAFAGEFVAAGQKFAVQIPSEFTNAVRAMINIEGIIAYLKPDLDVIATLGMFSKKLLADRFKKENINAMIFQAGLDIGDVGRSLPSHITQLMQDIEHDGVAVRLNNAAVYPVCDSINSAAARIAISMMFIGLDICLLLSNHTILFNIVLVLSILWTIILFIWGAKEKYLKNRLNISPFLQNMKRRSRWF